MNNVATSIFAIGLVACTPPDFDPPSHVASVRVLAMAADAPYAQPGQIVNMKMLAVDGRPSGAAAMQLYWIKEPCINPPGDVYFGCFAKFSDVLPPGGDLESLLHVGTTFSFRMPEDVAVPHRGSDTPYGIAVVLAAACAGHLVYTPIASTSPDKVPFACLDDDGRRLGPDAFVFAYAFVYSFTSRANRNPVIEGVTFGDSTVDPLVGINVDRCTESNVEECPSTKLDVVVPEASQESDPSNLDASGNILKEQIYVQYFFTGGKVLADTMILFDPRGGRLPNTGDEFRAPPLAGDEWLWVVVRDNRSGVTWQELPLHVH